MAKGRAKTAGAKDAIKADKTVTATRVKVNTESPAKRGRPATGKSSDEDYQQVSMWLKKTTVKKAKFQALETDTDFSDIVQEALEKHLPK